jgi:uncharacterized membrane protein YdbT with pleckstrin-like domain
MSFTEEMMTDSYLNRMLGNNEEILLVTRQHWFVLALAVITEVILAIGIAALTTMVAIQTGGLAFWGLLLLVIPGISFIRDYLQWENRQYVVTNRRVIQINGVINKNVTDSSLEKVNDVKMEQSMLGRMFNFGDVEILTASELGVNKLTHISNPVRLKTAMINAKERLEAPAEHREKLEEEIPGVIAKLDELRKLGVLTEAEFQVKKAELLKKL